jgi:hypothetical protein
MANQSPARTIVERGDDAVAERFAVTGVDLSAGQIERARRNVPDAEIIHADFTEVAFGRRFAAITAFYVIEHVPRERHLNVFERFHELLDSGGCLLFTVEPEAAEDIVGEWLGRRCCESIRGLGDAPAASRGALRRHRILHRDAGRGEARGRVPLGPGTAIVEVPRIAAGLSATQLTSMGGRNERRCLVLLLTMARRLGIPGPRSRRLCHLDPEVTEVWDAADRRWRLINTKVDTEHRDPTDGDRIDPNDGPRDRFLVAGRPGRRAAAACRPGRVPGRPGPGRRHDAEPAPSRGSRCRPRSPATAR